MDVWRLLSDKSFFQELFGAQIRSVAAATKNLRCLHPACFPSFPAPQPSWAKPCQHPPEVVDERRGNMLCTTTGGWPGPFARDSRCSHLLTIVFVPMVGKALRGSQNQTSLGMVLETTDGQEGSCCRQVVQKPYGDESATEVGLLACFLNMVRWVQSCCKMCWRRRCLPVHSSTIG